MMWGHGQEPGRTRTQRGGMETRAGRGDAGKENKLLVKKVKEGKKKTHGRDTEAGNVDAEAGNMQQAGDRGRKGESAWKQV